MDDNVQACMRGGTYGRFCKHGHLGAAHDLIMRYTLLMQMLGGSAACVMHGPTLTQVVGDT